MECHDSSSLSRSRSSSELIPSSVSLEKERTASDSERLNQIATALFANQDIKPADRQFLQNISATDLSKGKTTPKQRKAAEKVKKLTKKILKGKISPDSSFAHGLIDHTQASLMEKKAVADMLIAYGDKLQNPPFFQEASAIIKKEGTLSEKKITKLIVKHNKTFPPRPSKAGTLALEVESTRVFYDAKGRLKLAPPNKKTTQPIELPKANRKLTPAQVQQLKDIHAKIVNDTPYNNIGPMLEFMKFYREASANNPNLTLGEAFEAFDPSSSQVFDKYQSGDCVILAGKLQAEIKAQGFEAAITGQCTGPTWSDPPVPQPYFAWKDYDQATENVHHCLTVVRYLDEKKNDKGLSLNSFASTASANLTKEHQKYSEMKRDYGKKDTFENITNVGHVLKMQMKGKYKMALTGTNVKEVFGIDFIHGNIYVNSAGMKSFDAVPVGSDGRFSIALHDLQNPDDIGTYYVKGKAVQISHREALEAFTEAAQERFRLPDDFANNLIALAENTDAILDEILLPAVKTAKQCVKESTTAYNQVKTHRDKYDKYAMTLPQDAFETFSKLFFEMSDKFDELQQAVAQGDSKLVKSLAQEIDRLSNELAKLSSEIEEAPKKSGTLI